MNKITRLAPLFVALAVVLSAAPQASLAQVAVRPAVAPVEISGAAAASATGASALTALPALAPLNAAALPVNPALSAPALALAPALSAAAPALAAAAAPSNEAPTAAGVRIRTPGAAATGIAAEFASYHEAAPVAAPAARKSLVGRLTDVILGRASDSALFDASSDNKADSTALPAGLSYGARGFRGGPSNLKLARGVRLDPKPVPPQLGGDKMVLHQASFDVATPAAAAQSFSLVALDATPGQPETIEAALRKMIDDNPAQYKVSSAELGKLHIEKVDGHGFADDTYHAVFRQWMAGKEKDGTSYLAAVSGAYIAFVLKVVDGKIMLVPQATTSRLYSGLTVDTNPKFADNELATFARERLQADDLAGRVINIFRRGLVGLGLVADNKPIFVTREVFFGADKQWHTANLYRTADTNSPIMAVDVATGKAFAWDGRVNARMGLAAAPAKRAVANNARVIYGRGNTDPSGKDNDKVDVVPMQFLKIKDASGNVVAVTDENGLFSLNTDGSDPIQVTATLDNSLSHIVDNNPQNKPLVLQMTVRPGESTKAIFNTTDDPELIANINSLFYATDQVQWYMNDMKLNRMKGATLTTINTNVAQPCNAFFDPSANTLNLQHADTDQGCENTAQPSVIRHETGHFVVQTHAQFAENASNKPGERVFQPISSLMGDDVNEGTADTGAMFRPGAQDPIGNPNLGNGFFLANPDQPLRTGNGNDQYNRENPDPHQAALMQFNWQSRAALIQAGLYAAEDVARLMISTLMLNQPVDTPTAASQIALAFMKDGKIPDSALAIFQKIAKAHNIALTGVPSSPAAAKTDVSRGEGVR